ncbi:MAG: lamin tail domain-containing protein [Bacteroidales bacterium]|nr:lamin tail domain-containing protein [Bacteroidales bacterium]
MKKLFILSLAAVLAFSACVEDSIYPYASISDVTNTYAYDAATTVEVSATVTAFVDIKSVNLYYTAGKAAETSASMTAGSNNVYTATIPAYEMGTEVSYYIVAATDEGETTSATTKYTVGVTPPNYAAIHLNELNGKTKFIELINTGGSDVDLEGMFITKDGGETATWTAVKGQTLKAGELLLLYSEDVVVTGGDQEGYDENLVFHSGLSAKKAVRIQLFNPSGNCVDDFNLVECKEAATASYSRVPDGTGSWYHTAATPGAANENNTTKAVEGLQ